MKRLIVFVLFTLNLYLYSPSLNIGPPNGIDPAPHISAQELNNFQPEDSDDLGEEDDMFFYEQESFSRKLFQRKLEPLSKHHKIIWAFRMSEPDLFL